MPNGSAIRSLRLTLSDGTVSKKIGQQVNLTNSFEFFEERPIRSIRVKENGHHVWQMEFLDAQGKNIVEIKGGDNYGAWQTIAAKEGETIIGCQEGSDNSWLLAFGLITMKTDF